MKLQNKKTGEILEMARCSSVIKDKFRIYDDYNNKFYTYSSLAELNEEWQDYEEPKSWWYIDCNGEVFRDENADKEHTEEHKSIGNYYNSSKEAEKACDKLRAWKRLKDKGVEFYGWRRNQTGTYELYMRWEDRIPRSYEVKNDLDLLFGGEE